MRGLQVLRTLNTVRFKVLIIDTKIRARSLEMVLKNEEMGL